MVEFSHSDTKERIRQAVDIVDLIGSSISLRRQGSLFVGLCPFHADSKPSLQVRPDRQTWKCWVCGNKGGDVFTWVMENDRVDFKDALKLLAERAGIEIEQSQRRPTQSGSADDKTTLYDCCTWAEQQFHEFLLNSDAATVARQYLAERQINAESIEKFKLGFAPNDWNWLLDRARRSPFSPAVMEAVGLAGRSRSNNNLYDRFKGRVIFPIHSTEGRCIAFGGRILPQFADDKAAKYINSPETLLFSKSNQLYALNSVRNHISTSRSLTVVEGYTDVIMCHQQGVKDVVACLGTALNERHLQLIKRFADRVYLILDGDAAGQRRTNEILQIFVAAQFDLRIVTLPDEYDPCEFLLEHSSDDWQQMLQSRAVDAIEHKIRSATAGVDLVNDTFRANSALEQILQTIAQAPKPDIISSGQQALREQQILTRLAREFALDQSDLSRRLTELRKATRTMSPRTTDFDSAPEFVAELEVLPANQLAPVECELMELLVRHPELAPTALAELANDELPHDCVRTLFQVYRRLEEEGETLDFGRILSELEDARLQNLLVEFDERAEQKIAAETRRDRVMEDPASRMRGVIRYFQQRREEQQRRQAEAVLDKRRMDDQETIELLEQLLATKRQQQGIIAPTQR